MNIVIVTAEPLGGYHLEPLHIALRSASALGHQFQHLIPYPEKVQGLAWDHVTADLSVLATADLVVITGGGFTAWTELVARRCQQLGLPFVISELAYGAQRDGLDYPVAHAVSALSPAGAANLSQYHKFPLEDIVITGTPLLDALPRWEPVLGRVLILSSVDAVTRDPGRLLFELAEHLRRHGADVVVRCHPREDRNPWAGFEIDGSPTAAEAARHASVVVGYPGSAHPIAAALGVPVVAVAPTEALRDALPQPQAMVIPTWVHGLDDVAKIGSATPTSTELVIYANGPLGGAADRLIGFWLTATAEVEAQRR